jgi:Sulfatase
VGWLAEHGDSSQPWCLVMGLVNPHDICWYPADQPGYQARFAQRTAAWRTVIPSPIPGQPPVAPFGGSLEALFDLPANHHDLLDTKPRVQKQWTWEELHGFFGHIAHDDAATWRRALDYYFRLHELGDVELGRILDALDETGAADDTVVVYTSDHGEQAGSHGMRGKGPFAYDEIMRVPLVVRAPGRTTPGSATDSLTSSVDVASLLCSLAGVPTVDQGSLRGVDLSPLLGDPSTTVRDHVLFCQEQAWHRSCIPLNYALRGYFDGNTKYVRYYGTGGGCDNVGQGLDWLPSMRVPSDGDPWDMEQELYDLSDDPGELRNLAVEPSRRGEVEDHFAHLLELEAAAYTHTRAGGRGQGSTHRAAMLDEAMGDVSSRAGD